MVPKVEIPQRSAGEITGRAITKIRKAVEDKNSFKIISVLRRLSADGNEVGPDVYAAAIDALATLDRQKSAYDLWDEMKLLEIQPNVACYLAHLKACGVKGACKKAIFLLNEMKEIGVFEEAEQDEKLSIYNLILEVAQMRGEVEVAN